ncbi:polysaccharide deacetylase family protein [Desertivirga xinjiangensis]|uniref:polysaccharide deacetylase family protein n=1 Tax=Desertivirga xinjiangensis TaxID=539206 RepID=UPI00210B1F39|nr:polysaccharide deacetylase family protein [Pedobacter xinjiangensis]
MYLVRTPFFLRWLYPSLTWRKNKRSWHIYITFDDGPIPHVTPFVLETLKRYNAKATFFCIGDNIRKHPGIFEEIKTEGHAIGNHTFNHLKGWKTDTAHYIDNYLKCDKLMHSHLFRPPYGRIKRNQISKLKELSPDLQIIMWDVLSGDFDPNLSPEKCLSNVLKYTRPGSIIVFHDSLKAFDRLEYVLPRALEKWNLEGYEFELL